MPLMEDDQGFRAASAKSIEIFSAIDVTNIFLKKITSDNPGAVHALSLQEIIVL
jgi:hypothetical protein